VQKGVVPTLKIGVGTPFPRVPTPLHPWRWVVARQVLRASTRTPKVTYVQIMHMGPHSTTPWKRYV